MIEYYCVTGAKVSSQLLGLGVTVMVNERRSNKGSCHTSVTVTEKVETKHVKRRGKKIHSTYL